MLERARGGDEQAFRELTDPHRRELQVHCYRILGSLTDAEDMLQETLLAAWRGLGDFQERVSLRCWLYRIATNRCLNAVRAAGRKARPSRYRHSSHRCLPGAAKLPGCSPTRTPSWAGYPILPWVPRLRYQAAEAVELAFVAALQRMPPRQAATLVLRDVLGFTAEEVADMLNAEQDRH